MGQVYDFEDGLGFLETLYDERCIERNDLQDMVDDLEKQVEIGDYEIGILQEQVKELTDELKESHR